MATFSTTGAFDHAFSIRRGVHIQLLQPTIFAIYAYCVVVMQDKQFVWAQFFVTHGANVK